MGQHLHNGDIHAYLVKLVGNFHADKSAAENHNLLELLQFLTEFIQIFFTFGNDEHIFQIRTF